MPLKWQQMKKIVFELKSFVEQFLIFVYTIAIQTLLYNIKEAFTSREHECLFIGYETSSYLAVFEGSVPLGKVMTLFLTSSRERGTVKSTNATLEHINVSQTRAVISQSCHHLVLLSEFMWKTSLLLIVCAYLIGDKL